MAKKVSFSGENLSFADAALHHNDTDGALTLFFSTASPSYPVRFAGYKRNEVHEELGDRLAELDRNTTMSLLAAVEAAFRIDYLQRCYISEKEGRCVARVPGNLQRKGNARIA